MIHLRIVVPPHNAEHALDLLRGTDSVVNLIYLERAAQKPEGDVILCDVAREDASVVISDLREFDIHHEGSIAIEEIDSHISDVATMAEEAAEGSPSDAVVWEQVEARTSENIELSANFIAFFCLACMIAAVGVILDSPILIIGAMVVGPEFGPIAGLCVAIVQQRPDVAKRSTMALAVGFPAAITAAFLFTLFVRAVGLTPEGFSASEHPLTQFISHPDAFSFIVAYLAGVAGVLSLTSTKSGALIGVLISVTTIPAAANIGVAAAFADWAEWRGAIAQLSVNLAGIMLAGIGTLFLQRRLYMRRRVRHLKHEAREVAGLPIGRSRHEKAKSGPMGSGGCRQLRDRSRLRTDLLRRGAGLRPGEGLATLAEDQLGHPQVEGSGHLEVLRRGGVDQDPASLLLDQHCVIRRTSGGLRVRQGLPQSVRAKRLRRLHRP
jgi:uncharacterized hydrophobic protein (TIGR00271 family)